jgi:hypothetical protein
VTAFLRGFSDGAMTVALMLFSLASLVLVGCGVLVFGLLLASVAYYRWTVSLAALVAIVWVTL